MPVEIRALGRHLAVNLFVGEGQDDNLALVEQHLVDLSMGRPVALPPPPAPRPADVARTHAFLVEHDRRMRVWRGERDRTEAIARADAEAAAAEAERLRYVAEAMERSDKDAEALAGLCYQPGANPGFSSH